MKTQQKIKREKKIRRHQRVRAKISGSLERPRLSVYKSNKHIYAQLINDRKGETLVEANDSELKKDSKEEKSVDYQVGKLLAEKALKKNIKKVVFDRGGYKYHGRIKALAQGAKDGGLEF